MDTENTTPEPSLEESIKTLLDKVPEAVRNFVLNELPQKTEQMMFKYTLHVDQGGLLERELLLMLLGQEQPTEFVAALQEAGIPPQTVQSLVNDVNTEIFMKLHAEEAAASAPVQPVTPPAPAYMPPQPVVAPVPVAAPEPVPTPSISQFSEAPLYPSAPTQPMATPATQVPVTPTYSAPVSPAPSAPITPPPQPAASANRDALHAVLKEYGVDPYRELPD